MQSPDWGELRGQLTVALRGIGLIAVESEPQAAPVVLAGAVSRMGVSPYFPLRAGDGRLVAETVNLDMARHLLDLLHDERRRMIALQDHSKDKDYPSLLIGDSGLEIVWLDDIEFAADERGPGWLLGRAVVDPGVRYRPDGSGEPPSADFSEIAAFGPSAVGELVRRTARLVAEQRIDTELEALHLDRLAAEEEARRAVEGV